MIEWYTWIEIGVAIVAALICIGFGIAGRVPQDLTLGSVALVELLLVVQLVIAIISPFAGNHPTGNIVEFYIYLVASLIIPPLAAFWSLVERTRWSNVILGVAALALAVMVYRMDIIWTVQIA